MKYKNQECHKESIDIKRDHQCFEFMDEKLLELRLGFVKKVSGYEEKKRNMKIVKEVIQYFRRI